MVDRTLPQGGFFDMGGTEVPPPPAPTPAVKMSHFAWESNRIVNALTDYANRANDPRLHEDDRAEIQRGIQNIKAHLGAFIDLKSDE